jgi:lipoate-protein ligase A
LDKRAASGGRWRIRHERGAAGSLHAAAAEALNEPGLVRTVTFVDAAPALVLGSHQDASMFASGALAAAGLEEARRGSGGSAVLVGGGRVLWVDFVIPAGDPLWSDDVGRAAWWVGELWAAALGGGEVWRGGMRRTAWSSAVCFAGLAPGEVIRDGAKVVGVCQRRSPRAALFQTAALLRWDAGEYASLMSRPPGAVPELEAAARAVEEDAAALEVSLLARLDDMIFG